jgi:hypothetical protein
LRVYDNDLAMDEAHADVEILDISNGLVAYWSFDDGSGSVLHDQTSGGHNGTITGATWIDGVSGSALDFDASADRVVFSSPVLNQAPYTLCTWVRAASISSTSRYILSNGGQTRTGYGIYLYMDINKWIFGCYDDAGHGGAARMAATSTDWVFLCGSWNGSYSADAIKLYVNAQLATESEFGWWDNGAAQNLAIGSPSNMLTSYGWLGAIDEVRIYNMVLSDSQIRQLYQEYVGGPPVPTFSELGTFIFGTLLLASVAFYVRRRRLLQADAP